MIKALLCLLFGHSTTYKEHQGTVGAWRESVFTWKRTAWCLRCGKVVHHD